MFLATDHILKDPREAHGLMSVAEAAQALGLKPATIRVWIARRRIAHVKLGRSVKVPPSEVTRLINDNLVPARQRGR
jgi:excisionase family DNA binding protein